ncbi:hypothetical protein B0F90DRAFT_1916584 [Multifurca ochricompacta]|uniref:Uncharacterized protein n=1 Tax=Multifurca ochricompacta TaxID=376703 RepID=A0AAD4M6J9_9AGAM|nr:hypothetical protein B0F90DRAFT_1916584 [Multifurca ochricompacta]
MTRGSTFKPMSLNQPTCFQTECGVGGSALEWSVMVNLPSLRVMGMLGPMKIEGRSGLWRQARMGVGLEMGLSSMAGHLTWRQLGTWATTPYVFPACTLPCFSHQRLPVECIRGRPEKEEGGVSSVQEMVAVQIQEEMSEAPSHQVIHDGAKRNTDFHVVTFCALGGDSKSRRVNLLLFPRLLVPVNPKGASYLLFSHASEPSLPIFEGPGVVVFMVLMVVPPGVPLMYLSVPT